MHATQFTLELPLSELLECAAVAGRFVDPDERVETGNVWLTADGRHRSWRAAGSGVGVEIRGGVGLADDDVILPVRLVHAAALVAGAGDSVTLAVGIDRGRPAAELRGPGGTVTATTHPGATPRPNLPLSDEETAATAVLDVEILREAVAVARQIPFGFDQRTMSWPVLMLSVAPGNLELTVEWPYFGVARHSIPAATTGTGSAMVMPGYLANILDAYPHDEVRVKIPHVPGESVEVSADGWTGLVEGVDLDGDWPAGAEEVIAEACGQDAIDATGGNYLLATDPYVHGRFSDGPPWRLEVSSVVLNGVEASPELLAELNDFNQHLGLARVALRGTSVVMQADLLLKSLDADELRVTAAWIGEHSKQLAPVLAAVFGGIDPNRRSEESR